MHPASGPLSFLGEYAVPLVSWVHFHKWLVAAAIFAAPAVALIQGAYFLVRYRIQFGKELPVPVLPSHGVVVVSPTDKILDVNHDPSESSSIILGDGETYLPDEPSVLSGGSGSPMVGDAGARSKAWGLTRRRLSWVDWERLRLASEAPPLRLLVVGDSLAAGVGVSKSCTPVLPEVIAKALSKALGGRAVFWTCIAEPGASSGWIVRELGKFRSDSENMKSGSFSTSCSQRTSASLLEEEDCSDGQKEEKNGGVEEDALVDEFCHEREFEEWRKRLSFPSKRLESEVFCEFDVACIMTGLNDLKGAILPWLLQGDEVEFRRQARSRGGDYTSELKRVVDAVAKKMKVGLSLSLDRARTSVDNILVRDRMSASRESRSLVSSLNSETLPLVAPPADEAIKPLVVLLALPSNLPVLQVPPFIWFLLPLIRWADALKKKLADKYPNAILYVDSPSIAAISDFENRRGPCFDSMLREDILLSLKDVSVSERVCVEREMCDFCTRKRKRKRSKQKCIRREGAPGASLLCVDGIHPNDRGYEMWGRLIAAAICEKENIH